MMKKLNRRDYFLSVLLLVAAAYVLHSLLTSTDYYSSLSLTGMLTIKLVFGLVIYLLMTPVIIARMEDAGMRIVYVIIFWLSYFANVEVVMLVKQFMELNAMAEKLHLVLSVPIGCGALALLLYLFFKPSSNPRRQVN
jgi:hypothetical protein